MPRNSSELRVRSGEKKDILSRYSPLATRYSKGNAFIFVLLGVALFAALAFTVSRSMRSDTTTAFSGRQIELVASDILSYAASVARAVDRTRQNGCSENDISFENTADADYAVAGAEDRCKVFGRGGGLSWQDPPKGVSADPLWYIVANRVATAGGLETGTAENDLTLILREVDDRVCQAINNQLAAPVTEWQSTGALNGGDANAATKFTGSFTAAFDGINWNEAKPLPGAGCFCNGGPCSNAAAKRFFYSVILPR